MQNRYEARNTKQTKNQLTDGTQDEEEFYPESKPQIKGVNGLGPRPKPFVQNRDQNQDEDYQSTRISQSNQSRGKRNIQRGRGFNGGNSNGWNDRNQNNNYQDQENFSSDRVRRGRGRGRGRGFFDSPSSNINNPQGPQQQNSNEKIQPRGRGRGHLFPQSQNSDNFPKENINQENELNPLQTENKNGASIIQFVSSSAHRNDEFKTEIIYNDTSMNCCNYYKDFQKPEFFQAPKYKYHREQHSSNNPAIYFNERDIDYVQESRPEIKNDDYFDDDEQDISQNGKIREPFDFRQEKRKSNKFFKNEKKQKPERKQSHQGNGQSYFKEDYNRNHENNKKKPREDRQQREFKNNRRFQRNYNQFTQLTDEKLKEGLENGTLFQGIFRIDQNNRQKGYVTIDGIRIDVMVEGLSNQNMALDGDTLVIELRPVHHWKAYENKNRLERLKQKNKTYNNEIAVETRVVDFEEVIIQCNEKTKTIKDELINDKLFNPPPSSGESEEEKGDTQDRDEDLEDKEVGKDFLIDEQVETDSHKEEPISSSSSEEQKFSKLQNKPKKDKEVRKINGQTKEERLADINQIALEFRPTAKVRKILVSPNRKKQHLVTLLALDKELLDYEKMKKIFNQKSRKVGILAAPVSKKLPWMSIDDVPEEFKNDIRDKKNPQQRYYIVDLINWDQSTMRPICNIVQCIGEAGNLDAESLRILRTFDIYSEEYEIEGQPTQRVHESLRIFAKNIDQTTGEWKIPEEELQKRLDLRKKRIFTIDPITAKDLDDALSIEKITNSIYEIGVHIADVSYFVQQGTELDKEAQLRCTSVYFVHKVYPMLPRLLCERLCSLNPQVDRLSYSVFFRMDLRTGELDKNFTPKIARTVIRSCAKWNYQLVQDILDGKIKSELDMPEQYRPVEHKFNDMREDCLLMNEIAQKRRKKRLDNGSVMLQNREFVFRLDQESKMPMSFEESYRIESKFLVEEYMLLANILIAEHLFKYCKEKTLLRAHPDLDNEKKTALKGFFDQTGLSTIDLTNAKSFSISMEVLRESGESAKFNVAMRKFLSCLKPAQYLCINESEPEDYLHYGLNFPLYTHFTSPIRRYADLLVHRLVTLSLQHKDETRTLIEGIDYTTYAEMCSEKGGNAKKASTQCNRLFHCLLLKSQGIRVFETLLFDLDHGTISIYIDEVNMIHKLRLKEDPRFDYVIFFPEHLTVVALLKNKEISLAVTKENRDKFSSIKSLADVKNFKSSEILKFQIFDKVKVFVDTTTEFPLDIKCTLVFTPEDLEKYDNIKKDQEVKTKQDIENKTLIEIPIEEKLNDEI